MKNSLWVLYVHTVTVRTQYVSLSWFVVNLIHVPRLIWCWCQSSFWWCDLTHIHTCTHAHMHKCTHAHMHTCTHTHIHAGWYKYFCVCQFWRVQENQSSVCWPTPTDPSLHAPTHTLTTAKASLSVQLICMLPLVCTSTQLILTSLSFSLSHLLLPFFCCSARV